MEICIIVYVVYEKKLIVQVVVCHSLIYKAENGIPQGSVITPILFNIMINYIFDNFLGLFGREEEIQSK